jgi:prepilin-type N-terminal cleavage/methylation domain-containing protein
LISLFKKLKSNRVDNKAFSLVEVLCAIVLLALVATPVIQAIYSGLSLNLKSRKLLGASDITSGVMEFVSSTVFEDYDYTPTGGSKINVPGMHSYYWGGDAGDISKWLIHGIDKDGNSYNALYPNGPGFAAAALTKTDPKRELYFSNVCFDEHDFKYDVIITITDPKSTDSYYCYNVDVEVREPGVGKSGKLLSYASTKIANSY